VGGPGLLLASRADSTDKDYWLVFTGGRTDSILSTSHFPFAFSSKALAWSGVHLARGLEDCLVIQNMFVVGRDFRHVARVRLAASSLNDIWSFNHRAAGLPLLQLANGAVLP